MQSVCFRRANDKAPCNYVCCTLSSACSVSIIFITPHRAVKCETDKVQSIEMLNMQSYVG